MMRVAYAKHADSRKAAIACAQQLAAIVPRMLLIFCGGKHDPELVLEELFKQFGPVPIVGGSAAGAIAREGFGYSGLEIGALAFDDESVCPQLYRNGQLLEGEFEAGRALGAQVAGTAADDAAVLLFFDSIARSSPLQLHPASSIVAGFNAGLAGKRVTLMGGGLLTDFNLSGGWVFDGEGVRKHAAIALVFPPTVGAGAIVVHGCRPASAFMEITRIEGAEVFELDGEPALLAIERVLGLSLGSHAERDLWLIATLGQKHGDKFAAFDEGAYVNRLILMGNRARGSVTLFEPDFERGAEVQIMSRDNALMIDSVRRGVEAGNRVLSGEPPLFALYVDCAGRASAFSGSATEEAEIVIRDLDPATPLLGFYSGVEIAPFGGYSRPLDWTGVLAMFWRRP